MDAKKVGKRIQSARMERHLTQAELAQILDLTPKYLSNVECGAKCLSMDAAYGGCKNRTWNQQNRAAENN